MPTRRVRIRSACPTTLLQGGGGGGDGGDSDFAARRRALAARARDLDRDPAVRREYNRDVKQLRCDILAASGGSLVLALARGM